MGYKPKRKLLRLRFEDEEFQGLEVRAWSLSLGRFLQLVELLESENEEDLAELFEGFASVLVSWNVETDSGEPVEATLDGLRSLDIDFVLAIIMSWVEAISSVSRPLPKSLNAGTSFPEESIPMAVS